MIDRKCLLYWRIQPTMPLMNLGVVANWSLLASTAKIKWAIFMWTKRIKTYQIKKKMHWLLLLFAWFPASPELGSWVSWQVEELALGRPQVLSGVPEVRGRCLRAHRPSDPWLKVKPRDPQNFLCSKWKTSPKHTLHVKHTGKGYTTAFASIDYVLFALWKTL